VNVLLVLEDSTEAEEYDESNENANSVVGHPKHKPADRAAFYSHFY